MEELALHAPRRKPSITIAIPPSPNRSHFGLQTPPLPPSPHFRAKTHIDTSTGNPVFVLPSVPTHEPEDRASTRLSLTGKSVIEDAAFGEGITNSTGWAKFDNPDHREEIVSDADLAAENEDEEVLEELADIPDQQGEGDDGAQVSIDEPYLHCLVPGLTPVLFPQSQLEGLLLATQAAIVPALQTLLNELRTSAKGGMVSSEVSSASRNVETASTASVQRGYEQVLDGLISSVSEVAAAVSSESANRMETFANLNEQLDALSSEVLAEGSSRVATDGVTLANALGDLLQSLEKARHTSDHVAVESSRRQTLFPPQRMRQRTSSNVSSSTCLSREELRDPFAETSEPTVFVALHRLISSLEAKCPVQAGLSMRLSSGHPLTLPHSSAIPDERSAGPLPRRMSSLDGGPSTYCGSAALSSWSLHSTSAKSASSSALPLVASSVPSSSPLSPAEAEVWSHVVRILGLTRDLIASRSANRGSTQIFSDETRRTRSRRASFSSSASELSAERRPSFERTTRRPPKYPQTIRSVGANTVISSSQSVSMHLSSNLTLQEHKEVSNTSGSPSSILLRKRSSFGSLATFSACDASTSAPPSYSEHETRRLSGATDAQIREYQHRGLLAAFHSQEKSTEMSEKAPLTPLVSQSENTDEARRALSATRRLSIGSSLASNEELQRLQTSIDRAYSHAPQLVDQRAASLPVRGSLTREAPEADLNLQDLIDRLAESGKRLDDQRVAPPRPIVHDSVAEVPCVPEDSKQEVDSAPSTSRVPLKASANVFRRLTQVQLNSFKKISNGSRSKDKVRRDAGATLAATREMQQSGSVTVFSSTIQRPSGPQSASLPAASSTATGLAPTRKQQSLEDAELFDLLAASSSRSRFRDQEAVMRTKRPFAGQARPLSTSSTLPMPSGQSGHWRNNASIAGSFSSQDSPSQWNLSQEVQSESQARQQTLQEQSQGFRQGAEEERLATLSPAPHTIPPPPIATGQHTLPAQPA